MNIHDIALRIENPALLVSSDIPVLQELSRKYPYAQLIAILYLKALAKDQSLELEDELIKHAYKITDRVKLYEVLHEKEEVEIVQELFEEIPLHADITHESVPAETTIIEETIKQDVQTPIHEEAIIPINETPVIENEENESFESETILESKEPNENSLDLDIISNAISGVFEKEFEPIRNNEVGKTTDTTEIILDSKKTNAEKTVTIASITKESKQPFSAWLKAGGTSKENVKSETNVDKLIETFIQEDPKISQPKKEFYSPIKQAKKSLDSENLQYTETLANILSVQGNYPKAILAYEQLCLTIPEKKTFFVQKIKELKEKLNS